MKPRRWYSSPEVNPHPRPPAVRPAPARIYWHYTARALAEQGPIIRQQPPTPPSQPTAPTAPAPLMRRIEAA